MVTFYLDIYFLVNFAMDMILLSMVRRILRLSGKRRRIVLSGACGALWACILLYLPILPFWLELTATWILGGAMMAILAFGRMRIPEFGKTMCTLWLVTVGTGGALVALGEPIRAGWYLLSEQIPARFSTMALLCGMAGIYFGICGCVGFIKTQMREEKHLYEVTLWYRGKKKVVTALLDTGNQLYEPYGHEPVHVITYEACSQLCETVTQVIYIPFQAIGTKQGVLPGIKIDEMQISKGGTVVEVIQNPWLAISREPLSPDHGYEMLLNGKKNMEEL